MDGTSDSEYRRAVQYLVRRSREFLVPLEWVYRQSAEIIEAVGHQPDFDQSAALAENLLIDLFRQGVLVGIAQNDPVNRGRFSRWDGTPDDWLAQIREWIDTHDRLPKAGELAYLHDPRVLAAMDTADIDPSFVNLLTNMDAFLANEITAGQFDDLFTRWNSLTLTELKDGTSIGYDTYQDIFYASDDYVDDPQLREEIREDNRAKGYTPPLGPDELREVVAAARAKFTEELAAHGYDANGHKNTGWSGTATTR